MASANDHKDTLLSRLEDTAKGAVSVAALAYVAGVLIVNIHLLGLGLPAAELTQTRYVLVGSLWILLVATMAAALKIALAFAKPRPGEQRPRIVLALVNFGILFCFNATLISFLQFVQTPSPISASGAIATLVATFTAVPTLIAIGMVRRISTLRRNGGSEISIYGTALLLVVQIVFATFALAYYSTYSYPKFSGAIGGGATYEMLLAPADDSRDALRRLQLDIRPDGLVGPCELLLEDSDTYFLRVKDARRERVLRVSKALFDGAVSVK